VTDADIDNVISAQAALIAALDAGDVAAIETMTATLSQLLAAMRGSGAVANVRRERVDHALKQTEAARTRVNYLADRNRGRLDRLTIVRGGRTAVTYNTAGRLANSGR
jgi:hypothetical protein